MYFIENIFHVTNERGFVPSIFSHTSREGVSSVLECQHVIC